MYGEQQSYSQARASVNPQSLVYAIDFGAQAAGKRISTTKRRVRWRWGFSNQSALQQGQTGTACRGEEHEIILVWSVTSGKRQVTMDGQEVHYSSSRAGVLDFSWTMKGNHVLKLTAYASPPISPTPNFRQYDLFIDGQSFFSMPKVFELGLKGAPQAQSRVPGDVSSYRQNDRPANQEEADLQRAIQESIAEARKHITTRQISNGDSSYNDSYASGSYGGHAAPSPAPHDRSTSSDLLDFAGDSAALVPSHVQTAPYAQPPTQYPPAPAPYAPAPAPYAPAPAPYAPAPAPYAPAVPALTYGAPGAAPPAYPPQSYPPSSPATYNGTPGYPINDFQSPGGQSAASAPPTNGFPVQQPMHNYDDPFAPRPHVEIPPTQTQVFSNILHAYGEEQPQTPQGNPAQPNFNASTPLSMNTPLAIQSEEEANAPKMNDFDSALKNLVNFDDITAPAEGDIKLTMMKKEEEQKKNAKKSQPLAPVAKNVVGSNATLSQIQTVKGGSMLKDPNKIMSTPANVQATQYGGALVVYGDGPPPLRPAGVGLVHGQGYGYYGQK